MKKKVIISFIFFILIVVSNQIIFHFDIKRQFYDVEIINKAGKQRMFSQKLAKIALRANEAKNTPNFSIIMDKFSDVLDDFTVGNYYINHVDFNFYKNPTLEKLYKKNQHYFNNIEEASTSLLNDINNQELFNDFIAIINKNEDGFLISMDKIVDEYQKISENKIKKISKMQLIFNATTLILLCYVLFSIIIPLFKRDTRLTGYYD